MFQSINYNMKKSHLAILLNLLYWLPRLFGVIIYLMPSVNLGNVPVKNNFLLGIDNLTTNFVVFYLFYFGIFPFFFSNKKGSFLIFGSMLILLISAIGYYISQLITPNFMGMGWFWPVSYFLGCLVSALIACLIRAFLNWYSDIFYKKQLEKKNLEIELALLKAQINPHFLFNTLNNIDILIEQDAKKASIYLNKLSDILRFMLHESPAETVPLCEELKYINQYIELQRIRTSNADFVRFTVEGIIDNLYIAPMLFIPFIENAFKHCTDKKINNAITIDLKVKELQIYFICSNALNTTTVTTQPKSGLGLDLIKNRLKLLYKENYNLKIDRNDERFIVTLAVKLHDN
jgi:two-component system LytT family sensor kinase